MLFASIAAAVLFGATGLNAPFDGKWRESIADWAPREASGQIHIVEIDAASLAAVNRWPWPRRHYARLVDQLDDAGVRSIAFDVDFSAPSDPVDDAAFADALAQSRAQVYLPTFSQAAGDGESRALEALPIEELRRSAILASVMMMPDEDGFVRSLPMGTVTAETPRPSLAAASAGANGAIGETYAIDLSIRPATIPRHSFVEIEQGDFAAEQLRGKDIIVGATAIEVFDRYPVPLYGVIPGVVVQALGAETLISGRFLEVGWILPLTLAALLSLWVVRAATVRRTSFRFAVLAMISLSIGFALQATARVAIEIFPALVCLGSATAINIARHSYRRFQHSRLHDLSTDLPNRRAFEQANKDANVRFTIAMTLDNFEALQAVVGEEGSDTLIKRLADRITERNRVDQVFRADRQVLVWTVEAPDYELEYDLEKLEHFLRAPLEIDWRSVDPNVTFGVAAGASLNKAIHAARLAASQARKFAFHADAEQTAIEQRISLLGELDAAIEREELQVWFQPQLDLKSGEIASVEALVRWQHPERGFLSPDYFIPLAEKSNRVDAMTLYVLRKTIVALEGWCAAGTVLRAAVNISARLLSSESFISNAENLISASGIPRDRLMFEVTESAALDNPEASTAALRRLRDFGIAISIDDYGTGQSSLSYLKNMPVSELKIDRSFVQNAHKDPSDALLVRSTIHLAHEMGLMVVAEGVEDSECLEFLKSVECDIAQGYLIGKPMTCDDVARLTAENRFLAA